MGASIRTITARTSARRDRGGLQLAPARQQMTRNQLLGLFPGLVVLLGVQLDVLARQIGEGAGQPFGLALSRRVFSLDDVEHDLRRQPARVGQADTI